MLQVEREEQILRLLKSKRVVELAELQQLLGVSRMTLWRDIQRISPRHAIKKVHGGVMLAAAGLEYVEDSMEKRRNINADKKAAIARKAAALVKDGQTVSLDPSSSSYYLARELSSRGELRVITNCLEVAAALRRAPSVEVLITGGILKGTTSSLVGPQVADFFKEVTTDWCFFSTTGISPDRRTLLDINPLEIEAKQSMLRAARRSVLLFDSSKLKSTRGNLPVIKVKQVDHVISDHQVPLRAKRSG